jgi:hypothetical protein
MHFFVKAAVRSQKIYIFDSRLSTLPYAIPSMAVKNTQKIHANGSPFSP